MSIVALKDVAEISMGNAPEGSSYNTEGVGVPLVAGAADLGDYVPKPKKFTTNPTKISKTGDLIICVRATIGDLNISDKEYCLGRGVAGLRANKNLIMPDYLFFLMKAKDSYLKSLGTGSTFLQIKKADIEDIKFELPKMEDQQIVVGHLKKISEAIKLRNNSLAALDHCLHSLFMEMFGDPIQNPNKWKMKNLDEVISDSFQNGAYFPQEKYSNAEDAIEMIHMSDAFGGCVRPGSLKKVIISDQDLNRYALNERDILIARRSLNYEGSAKPCLIPKYDKPLIFESSLIRIRPSEELETCYLFHYLNNERVRKHFVYPLVTKSTISGINQKNLSKIKVMVPSVELQKAFAVKIGLLNRLKAEFLNSRTEMDTLFLSLNSKFFDAAASP